MNSSKKIKNSIYQLKRYIWTLAVIWTAIIIVLLVWHVTDEKHRILESARIQARTAHERDVIYRSWNARHGGVYVSVTEETQPNPYLLEVPERDIKTPSGKLLTMMNPAYMTRQVYELAKKKYNVLGHITSLKPLRSDNAPDPWEAKALKELEGGESEFSSVEKIEGKDYMRLISPLITERACLQCHAMQGYKEGDIRGGISIAIPMEPSWGIMRMGIFRLVLGHVLLWLIGLGGIILGGQRLIKGERERGSLTNMIVHDIRNLLTVIIGYTTMLLSDKNLDESAKKRLTAVEKSSNDILNMSINLLEVEKLESGTMPISLEPVNVCELVKQRQQIMLSQALEKGIRLDLHKPEQDIMVNADKNLLFRILDNIIFNAIKFCPDRGSVEIGISVNKGMCEVWVINDGTPIPREYHGLIFEKFAQVEVGKTITKRGVGLGLAFCKMALKAMNGAIGVESPVSGREDGAKFVFNLPIAFSHRL